MKKVSLNLVVLVITVACNRETKPIIPSFQRNDLIGEWSDKSENEFLLFKDSVVLPTNFYLFTNWKLDSSHVKIYNIESSPRSDSVWVDYLINSFYKDSLVVTSSAFDKDSSITLYKREPIERAEINHIKLNRLVYPGEDTLFEINLTRKGNILFKELSQEGDWITSECSLNKNEMNILSSILDRIRLSELDSMYISGISDQDYYSLKISTEESDKIYSVIVDTGNVAPDMVSRVITFIWATTKLKCTPSRYNHWNAPSSGAR